MDPFIVTADYYYHYHLCSWSSASAGGEGETENVPALQNLTDLRHDWVSTCGLVADRACGVKYCHQKVKERVFVTFLSPLTRSIIACVKFHWCFTSLF